MTPLVVTARVLEGVVLRHPIHLDALLDAAWCHREGILLHPSSEADLVRFPLPLARSVDDRFWLASAGHYSVAHSELRYKNRRAPWVEYARFGTEKIARVQINFGPNKSYRVPYEFMIPTGGEMTWWCMGDADPIRELLYLIHYLAKHRNSGKGKIREWRVEPCEPWDGFPVFRDGMALRNVPAGEHEYGQLERCEPPYWMKEGRVPCLVPVTG